MNIKTAFVRCNEGLYQTKCPISPEEVIKTAAEILFQQISGKDVLTSPKETARYLQLALANEVNEHFAVLYLDSQNRSIAFETLFKGSINSSAVYPRVVAQKCLENNAAAVIFAHNHPSGTHSPSHADKHITKQLKGALALIDVKTLDHIIVSGTGWTSLAELGEI